MTGLDKLAAIVAKMTPGPWHWEYASPGFLLGSYSAGTQGDGYRIIKCVLDGAVSEDLYDCNVIGDVADRDGIAALRNVADELIAVAKAAKDYCNKRNCFCGTCVALAALEAKIKDI